MYNNEQFLDLINILSLCIGVQNLQENREQSGLNNIHIENDKQAKYLLSELSKQFEEQNKLLNKILNILEDLKNANRSN